MHAGRSTPNEFSLSKAFLVRQKIDAFPEPTSSHHRERAAGSPLRSIPPQFPVELLVGARSADIPAIMKAWSSAFRVRCEQIEAEFTARMAR